jgi:hypothetical protein
VRIKVERTGGFAGISKYSEIDSKNLPSSIKTDLINLVNENKKIPNSVKLVPKGAADHFTYRITINDGSKQRVIVCDQYTINTSLRSLVTYVEKHNTSNEK